MGPVDSIAEQGTVLPLGAPTSVGSLPHVDREVAISFVLDRTPELPAAPTLPGIEPLEMMIPQAAWGIAGVELAADGTLSIPDPDAVDPLAPLGDRGLSGRPFGTWRRFLDRVAGRTDPVKLQLTGPLTLGLMLIQAGLPPKQAFAVSSRAVSTRASDLLDLADARAPGVPRLLVFDEPGLVGGLRADLLLAADDVIDPPLRLARRRRGPGPHGRPLLWCHRLAARAAGRPQPPVAARRGRRHRLGRRARHVPRAGGWVAWGAVNTDGPLGESPSRSWRQLSSQWCELVQSGCDPVLLRRQSLVTPVCGLALHDEAQADHVFALTRRLAEKIHDQVMGIRLSVGA